MRFRDKGDFDWAAFRVGEVSFRSRQRFQVNTFQGKTLGTYQVDIDQNLLATRLIEIEAIAEWKSFAALAVNTLGMPATGNSGHNRDSSYISKTPYIIRKTISLWHHTQDGLQHIAIFPKHTIITWGNMIKKGLER